MIGLIVNPIAGMGGAVGLKGTDGAEILAQAQALGAEPRAAERARRAMAVLASAAPGARILAAGGPMGAEAIEGIDLEAEILPLAGPPSARETRRLAMLMRDRGVALLLFAGGDGTARDIEAAVGLETPVLGVPCGVKMQSGVFAVTPEAAGRLAAEMLVGGPSRIGFRKVEIMDIDEEAVRAGRISGRLYGYARAPQARRLLQAAKGAPPLSDDAMLEAVCQEIAIEIDANALTLIGPGATAKRVLAALGHEGALLGVDAVRGGRLVGRDVTEVEALRLAGEGPVRIVVGVTGGQGFVFGRGNQPIGAEAIRRAGPGGLTIVASAAKLAALAEPVLLVDTGDPALDRALSGHVRVRTGPRRSMMMRLEG